ncbi:hypothetical protein A2118_03440 [Candidatus Kaiserbacteria bacterium GWA2_50_9]|uniref:Uncharacterized protein n=1 Tax=Candidatus Kaiserbacteria bacterium GWA2_50_9 TaxID=1798474 RepID=A0A1F6BWA1_9BACT|nr:MAG: hypothetical protein A2118_03440 [Candidatus Kaiserbacteria bacterium GWA2_50_9]
MKKKGRFIKKLMFLLYMPRALKREPSSVAFNRRNLYEGQHFRVMPGHGFPRAKTPVMVEVRKAGKTKITHPTTRQVKKVPTESSIFYLGEVERPIKYNTFFGQFFENEKTVATGKGVVLLHRHSALQKRLGGGREVKVFTRVRRGMPRVVHSDEIISVRPIRFNKNVTRKVN